MDRKGVAIHAWLNWGVQTWPTYFCKISRMQKGALLRYTLVNIALSATKKGILVQKYSDWNGRCIAIFSEVSGSGANVTSWRQQEQEKRQCGRGMFHGWGALLCGLGRVCDSWFLWRWYSYFTAGGKMPVTGMRTAQIIVNGFWSKRAPVILSQITTKRLWFCVYPERWKPFRQCVLLKESSSGSKTKIQSYEVGTWIPPAMCDPVRGF